MVILKNEYVLFGKASAFKSDVQNFFISFKIQGIYQHFAIFIQTSKIYRKYLELTKNSKMVIFKSTYRTFGQTSSFSSDVQDCCISFKIYIICQHFAIFIHEGKICRKYLEFTKDSKMTIFKNAYESFVQNFDFSYRTELLTPKTYLKLLSKVSNKSEDTLCTSEFYLTLIFLHLVIQQNRLS